MISSSDKNDTLHHHMPTNWEKKFLQWYVQCYRRIENDQCQTERPWASLRVHIIVGKSKPETDGLSQNLGFVSSGWLTSCKIHKLFLPQFPHLQKGDDNSSPSAWARRQDSRRSICEALRRPPPSQVIFETKVREPESMESKGS